MQKKFAKTKRKHPVKPLLDPLPLETIIQHWKQFRAISWKKASLYAIGYLTGARVSEIKELRRKDITIIKRENKEIMLIKLITLKNQRHKTRIIPIVRTGEYIEMFDDLKEWIKMFRSWEKLFPYSRQWLRIMLTPRQTRRFRVKRMRRTNLKEEYPLIETRGYYWGSKKVKEVKRPYYFHFLRHCRLSHLATYHHFDALKLMYWAGWTDPKLANIYVRMDWWALAKAVQKIDEW